MRGNGERREIAQPCSPCSLVARPKIRQPPRANLLVTQKQLSQGYIQQPLRRLGLSWIKSRRYVVGCKLIWTGAHSRWWGTILLPVYLSALRSLCSYYYNLLLLGIPLSLLPRMIENVTSERHTPRSGSSRLSGGC